MLCIFARAFSKSYMIDSAYLYEISDTAFNAPVKEHHRELMIYHINTKLGRGNKVI